MKYFQTMQGKTAFPQSPRPGESQAVFGQLTADGRRRHIQLLGNSADGAIAFFGFFKKYFFHLFHVFLIGGKRVAVLERGGAEQNFIRQRGKLNDVVRGKFHKSPYDIIQFA